MARKSAVLQKGDDSMERSTSTEASQVVMTEVDPELDEPQAGGRIVRLTTGGFPEAIRERLKTLQAQRYLLYKQEESIKDLLEMATELGLAQLEAALAETQADQTQE